MSLSDKVADEIVGPQAGKSPVEIAELLGARLGRSVARPTWCSGAIEKNVEAHIARRLKRDGRSWTRSGAEHLAQLLWLQGPRGDWTHWWHKTTLA
jgi:hypothetical protein